MPPTPTAPVIMVIYLKKKKIFHLYNYPVFDHRVSTSGCCISEYTCFSTHHCTADEERKKQSPVSHLSTTHLVHVSQRPFLATFGPHLTIWNPTVPSIVVAKEWWKVWNKQRRFKNEDLKIFSNKYFNSRLIPKKCIFP